MLNFSVITNARIADMELQEFMSLLLNAWDRAFTEKLISEVRIHQNTLVKEIKKLQRELFPRPFVLTFKEKINPVFQEIAWLSYQTEFVLDQSGIRYHQDHYRQTLNDYGYDVRGGGKVISAKKKNGKPVVIEIISEKGEYTVSISAGTETMAPTIPVSKITDQLRKVSEMKIDRSLIPVDYYFPDKINLSHAIIYGYSDLNATNRLKEIINQRLDTDVTYAWLKNQLAKRAARLAPRLAAAINKLLNRNKVV